MIYYKKNIIFPFSAIIRQNEIKITLILNVIDIKIGGIIVIGDRGTGKSTRIRSIIDILPIIQVVKEDPFQSDPFDIESNIKNRRKIKVKIEEQNISIIDLPLGATEDRVCGTLDIEKAIRDGIKAFQPGLLAIANRGILYVDEVNLLDDHLVDVLLDSAASGINTVERDGISITHPSRFILIGSGNPEEGELRPQLMDRFGLHAKIKTSRNPEERIKIVENRTKFEYSPEDFYLEHIKKQKILRNIIIQSKKNIEDVEIEGKTKIIIAEICSKLNVEGMRRDLVINRSSRCFTAFRNCFKVTAKNICNVRLFCLRHRLRKDPLDTIDCEVKIIDIINEIFEKLKKKGCKG